MLLWWRSDFYCCCWALQFAGHALYAVFLAGGVSFAVRKRMPRYINHVVERNGANVCADPVSYA
jgi:hypothetical protein